jgi:hypothetical protein
VDSKQADTPLPIAPLLPAIASCVIGNDPAALEGGQKCLRRLSDEHIGMLGVNDKNGE